MQGSKLIELVDTFSKIEMNRLQDFVHSPYFNKNEKVKGLFELIYKAFPHFKKEKISKKVIFPQLFPKQVYDDLKLRHIMTLLLKLTEAFLVHESMGEEEVEQNLKLMRVLRRRQLHKLFSSTLKRNKQLQKKEKQKGILYFYNQYRLQLEEEKYHSLMDERRTQTNLEETSAQLDIFYITNKLSLMCEVINHQNVYNQQYKVHLMEEVLQHLKKEDYQTPIIQLYYTSLLTQMEKKEAHFFELKKLLQEHREVIPKKDLENLNAIARNFAIRQLNAGNEAYYREVFDLYQLALNSGVLLNDKEQLYPSIYKNIVSIGLKLGELEWIEHFIHEYAPFIESEYRHNSLNYALGKYHFTTGNYQTLIPLLNQIDYTDIFMMLDSKVILIKTYYELEEWMALESLLESFKQLLKRKKILGYHKTNYLNIAQLTQQLMNLQPRQKEKRLALQEKISRTQPLTEQEWLLSKL